MSNITHQTFLQTLTVLRAWSCRDMIVWNKSTLGRTLRVALFVSIHCSFFNSVYLFILQTQSNNTISVQTPDNSLLALNIWYTRNVSTRVVSLRGYLFLSKVPYKRDKVLSWRFPVKQLHTLLFLLPVWAGRDMSSWLPGCTSSSTIELRDLDTERKQRRDVVFF